MSFEKKLIEKVKENEILYKKSSGGYKNVGEKSRIWKEIAVSLNSTDDSCEKRWKSLRDRYGKELKKTYLPSGSAYEQSRSPENWEFWHAMSFIKDYVIPRKPRGSYKSERKTSCIKIDEGLSITCAAESSTSSRTDRYLSEHKETENDAGYFDFNTNDALHIFESHRKKQKFSEYTPHKTSYKPTDDFKTYPAASKKPSPQLQPQAITTLDPFIQGIALIISTLPLRKQTEVKAGILKYLSDVQLEVLLNSIN